MSDRAARLAEVVARTLPPDEPREMIDVAMEAVADRRFLLDLLREVRQPLDEITRTRCSEYHDAASIGTRLRALLGP